MAREDFSFFHTLRVRWAEADMQGVVFNAHYLTFFDVALTEYFRALQEKAGGNPGIGGEDLFVAHAELDYHDSARYDDVLDIGVRIERFGRSSMVFRIEIFRGDAHLISGQLVYVFTGQDASDRRPTPVPDRFRDLVAEFEAVTPET
ncbi:MAG: acyl-CoA thioesterase [Ectothiorhodospiraceae bacterium]|nr:acyl-CoA thioesterase [Ectothiorhodospiraceae bacterium]